MPDLPSALRPEAKRAEELDDKLRFNKIYKKAYDRLGDFHQKGEDAHKRRFASQRPAAAFGRGSLDQAAE